MKKTLLILTVALFVISFVSAAQNMQNGSGNLGTTGSGEQIQAQVGTHTAANGEQIQIKQQAQNRFQIHAGEYSANCSCNLTQKMDQNRTRLYTHLSNGQNAEIKIMPDTAAEQALERLRLRVCNENCTIELKEVGNKNQEQLAYEVKAQKQAKVFGLFKTKMQVQAQVSAENGEVIRVNKPWWSFLASEESE